MNSAYPELHCLEYLLRVMQETKGVLFPRSILQARKVLHSHHLLCIAYVRYDVDLTCKMSCNSRTDSSDCDEEHLTCTKMSPSHQMYWEVA